MTNDFVEDLAEALDKEGWPYLIVVAPPGCPFAQVRADLGGWKPARPEVGVREDLHQLLDVTVFDEA